MHRLETVNGLSHYYCTAAHGQGEMFALKFMFYLAHLHASFIHYSD